MALTLALLTAVSVWLSAGTLAISGGDTTRIAALPSFGILALLAVGLPAAVYFARLTLAEAWPFAISLLLWLPFLPGSLPGAFLLWQGPLEAIVWLAVGAGLIAARPPRWWRLATSPATAHWLAAAIVAVSSLVVFTQVRGVVPGGDEPHYLAATQSLLGDGDLRVANNYANGDYLAYFGGRLEPHFLKRSTSGEIYSIHAPGVSVIVLPAFAIAGYNGAVWTMVLIAALTVALTWRLAWRLSGSVAGAWVGSTSVFATAPYFFHTFTVYPEVIGGFCLVCGVWLLFELADGHEIAARDLIGVGAALATLPWLHTRFAVLAGLLGLILLIRMWSRPGAIANVATFLAVPIAAGALWFGFFWVIWGSPSPAAPYGADTGTSTSYIVRGLIGLIADQQFGLVTTAPIYLAAAAGAIAMGRQRFRLSLELLIIVAVYTVTVASYQMWWAGSAAPARFLVAILPLAALPIAMLFQDRKVPAVAPQWVLVLLLVSVALIVPRAAVEGGRFIFNNRGTLDGTAEWLSQTVDLPMALPSVHRDGGFAAVRDGAVWLTLFAGAALVSSRIKRAAGLRWTFASITIAMAAMMATTMVWTFHRAAAITPDRSKLAALAGYRPAWQPTLFDASARRRLSQTEFLSAMSFDISRPGVRINRVPAGEYVVNANPASQGTVSMFVGRNDPPFDSPQVGPAPEPGFNLRLPVRAQWLNFTTKDVVPEAGPWLTLTPVSVTPPASSRNAVRAARYGTSRVFFFDERAYPEPDGFWIRADGRAEIVIDTDDAGRLAGLPITVVAGAVPTTVDLSSGAWSEHLALDAGQRHELTLPPAHGRSWALSLRSGSGFRPSERDPGSRDVRLLSAWIAIR